MDVVAELSVQRYGYYPKGNGEAILTVKPTPKLQPFLLETFGNLQSIQGVSVCTFLDDRKVAERQANSAAQTLTTKGFRSDIRIINDTSNSIQKGSSITLWAETNTGAIIGSDAIGELRKMAEAVGAEAAQKLLGELTAKPTVDEHLADMLIPYVALAEGASVYLTRCFSEHLEANIWLAEKMLGAHFNINRVGGLYRVEKLADNDAKRVNLP